MLYGLCGYGDHHNARKWYVWSKINVIPKTMEKHMVVLLR